MTGVWIEKRVMLSYNSEAVLHVLLWKDRKTHGLRKTKYLVSHLGTGEYEVLVTNHILSLDYPFPTTAVRRHVFPTWNQTKRHLMRCAEFRGIINRRD